MVEEDMNGSVSLCSDGEGVSDKRALKIYIHSSMKGRRMDGSV